MDNRKSARLSEALLKTIEEYPDKATFKEVFAALDKTRSRVLDRMLDTEGVNDVICTGNDETL